MELCASAVDASGTIMAVGAGAMMGAAAIPTGSVAVAAAASGATAAVGASGAYGAIGATSATGTAGATSATGTAGATSATGTARSYFAPHTWTREKARDFVKDLADWLRSNPQRRTSEEEITLLDRNELIGRIVTDNKVRVKACIPNPATHMQCQSV